MTGGSGGYVHTVEFEYKTFRTYMPRLADARISERRLRVAGALDDSLEVLSQGKIIS